MGHGEVIEASEIDDFHENLRFDGLPGLLDADMRKRSLISIPFRCPIVFITIAMLICYPAFAGTASGGLSAGSTAFEEPRAGSRNLPVELYVFWRAGCPHCSRAMAFLERLAKTDPSMRLHALEVSEHTDALRLFIETATYFGIERTAVPLIVVGDKVFVGYLDDSTTGAAIRAAAAGCRRSGCEDVIASLIEAAPTTLEQPGKEPTTKQQSGRIPETLDVPVIGTVSTKALSLPLLTILLGAIDGFNPCAMWVLVFLIGLLLGMKDHKRMWALGGAFLVASAAVYFVFMAAWLNLLLLLGAMLWIRIAVGLVAVGGGAYYLREYVLRAEDVCKVTSPTQRRKIMERFRRIAYREKFLLALGGIIVLAFAVNLIELLCSAGIPAVYTQILAMSEMPRWTYYLYLLLYIAVFLLDDVFVFVTAMVTLQATGMTTRYARYSHLIGGLLLITIGVLLLLRPEWLTFGGG